MNKCKDDDFFIYKFFFKTLFNFGKLVYILQRINFLCNVHVISGIMLAQLAQRLLGVSVSARPPCILGYMVHVISGIMLAQLAQRLLGVSVSARPPCILGYMVHVISGIMLAQLAQRLLGVSVSARPPCILDNMGSSSGEKLVCDCEPSNDSDRFTVVLLLIWTVFLSFLGPDCYLHLSVC